MVVTFSENESLTQTALISRLHICKKTFIKYKKDILEDLALAWDYEVRNRGRSTTYIFKHQKNEYNFETKRQKKAAEKEALYKKLILQTVEESPYNTITNINNAIYDTVYDQLGYALSTSYEYVRQRVRKWFRAEGQDGFNFDDTIGYTKNKIWCRYDAETGQYIPLPEEQVKDLTTMLSQRFQKIDADIQLCEDYMSELITLDELKDKITENKLTAFYSVMEEFSAKYKCVPKKVIHFVIDQEKE